MLIICSFFIQKYGEGGGEKQCVGSESESANQSESFCLFAILDRFHAANNY